MNYERMLTTRGPKTWGWGGKFFVGGPPPPPPPQWLLNCIRGEGGGAHGILVFFFLGGGGISQNKETNANEKVADWSVVEKGKRRLAANTKPKITRRITKQTYGSNSASAKTFHCTGFSVILWFPSLKRKRRKNLITKQTNPNGTGEF